MNIQANRAHSPLKEFFQSPQVQRSLKITAVALAAFAVIGALAATAVILGMPLLTLIAAPVAIGAIALSMILAKRSEPIPAPQVQAPAQIVPAVPREQSIEPAPEPIFQPAPVAVFPPYQPAVAPINPPRQVATHESLLKNFEEALIQLGKLALHLAAHGLQTELNEENIAQLRMRMAELEDILVEPINQDRLEKWTTAIDLFHELDDKALLTLLKKGLFDQGYEISLKGKKELSPICLTLAEKFESIGDLDNCFKLARGIGDTKTKDLWMAKLAEVYRQAGNKEKAFEVIKDISYANRDAPLAKLADAFIKSGEREKAFEVIKDISYANRDAPLAKLVDAYLQSGDKEGARKVADDISYENRKAVQKGINAH